MNDNDSMPWGIYKNKPIGDVPFEYLLRLYKKSYLGGKVLHYFEKQLKVLKESELQIAELTNKKPKKYLIENYKFKYPSKKTDETY